jgi:hypothetical protein
MKSLTDVCPDPKKVLGLKPEQLGQHVLGCLSNTNEPNIERAIIAKTLSSNYHQGFQNDIAHAIEEAVSWLSAECLLGARPYNQDLIYLTQRGKKAASDYESEHPANIT